MVQGFMDLYFGKELNSSTASYFLLGAIALERHLFDDFDRARLFCLQVQTLIALGEPA